MASASPIASAAVVLAVGARPSGQASCSTLTSMFTSASLARRELSLPVSVTKGIPRRLMIGRIVRISSVSPEFDSAITMSDSVIIPRSP